MTARLDHWKGTPYTLVSPSLLFLFVFFAWPMVAAILLAFRTDDGAWTSQWFQQMTADVAFGDAVRNTVLIIILVLPIQFALALAMALIVNSQIKGAGMWVYVFAIPIAVSDLAAGIVWFAIFTENGYLNTVLTQLGILDQPFVFLNIQTPWPLIAVVIAEAWRATSIVFVILIAGLQGIPEEYAEAAKVFGAGWWARLWRVTLPMLRPSIQVALILRTILALQVFAVVVALTGGNLKVLALEAFNWYASYRNEHIAAAYATIILLASLIITIVYLRLLRVREEESG